MRRLGKWQSIEHLHAPQADSHRERLGATAINHTNGEGQGTTETVSLMLFSTAVNAQFHCATGFTPPSFPNQEGNVQVDP